MELIHYGSGKFDPNLFLPIKNEYIKPIGGLWTSPIYSNYGWKDWCDDSGFRNCDKEKSFKLKLKEGSRIFTIDSFYGLSIAPINGRYINFEELLKKYDAIHLTENGESETRFSDPSLYGWDCETVLIMNKNCIDHE